LRSSCTSPDFLDAVGSKAQRFIRNKRRLIELLKEQKQNVINQAVTRGLDPKVKLKPSGVEWIGDIPEHWEVRRLRIRFQNDRGRGNASQRAIRKRTLTDGKCRSCYFDRDHAVDLAKLFDFLNATQPEAVEALGIGPKTARSGLQFLHRLQGEIAKRGVVDVLRNGVKHGPAHVDLFYGTPTPGNVKAEERFAANIFSVTRQLRYSQGRDRTLRSTWPVHQRPAGRHLRAEEQLTKQTVEDAVQQYKRDRDPKELLFQFGRCMVHFAVDDHEVRMCTHLKGKARGSCPSTRAGNDGAGNPPNPAWAQDRLPLEAGSDQAG
jgi:hypothetical protein